MKRFKALIEAGADINQARNDGCPIIAAQKGHHETAQALIAAGADINQANKYGETPLYNAAHRGHAEVVMRLLIEECERVDLPDSVSEELKAFIKDTQGWTKLHYASYLGDCDLVSSVLHEGVDIDFTAERGSGKYKCTPIDAVKIKEDVSSLSKALDRANVVNVISLLQAAMNPFQLHLAMANPYLYQQAWSQEIRDGLFMTLLSHHTAQEGRVPLILH